MIKDIAVKNRKVMKRAIKILPVELTRNLNFKNYLLKYGSHTFHLRVELYKDLHIIYVHVLEKGLRRYPTEDAEEHRALVINKEVYQGYEGYGIHIGSRNTKLSKLVLRLFRKLNFPP